MFACHFCTYRTQQLVQHLEHRKFHLNITENFHCGFNGCDKKFRLQSSFRSHLLRTHEVLLKRPETDIPSVSHAVDTKFICSMPLCMKEFNSLKAVVKHLKSHIRQQEKIRCPFRDCNNEYNVVQSFTGHISKKHKNPCYSALRLSSATCVSARENLTSNENVIDEQSNLIEECPSPDFSDDVHDYTEYDDSMNPFFLNMAQFFLKMESQLLLPVSSIQKIIKGTLRMHEQGQEIVMSKLKKRFHEENLLSDKVDFIVNQIFSSDPFRISTKKLDTDYKRKKIYKEHCAFVNPVHIPLSTDHEEEKFFHYVPIHQTLRELFTDKSVCNELIRSNENREQDVQKDFTDGSIFRNSAYFQDNPNALKLIIYQDAFEVVNPIGTAVHKHKLVGIYLSIGNLPAHVRSHVNAIKPVALCKEKDFDHDKVYGTIIEDLKTIESDGIQMPSGEVIKGSLVFIAGDNLGSHSLGGFVENFSTSIYFCRYCLITRNELHNDEVQPMIYERRTIENYNDALQQKGENNHYQGVKFNSKFNELSNYHVCEPGLPPCLGHDVLEGVGAHDLKLYIDYFIKKGWVTLSLLNKRIDSFSYSSQDQRDKPCLISMNKNRIVGGAWQIFIFIKIFPLLVEDKIRDAMDDVWLAVILLQEIVEIICAPAIHKSYLPYLQTIIDEYIVLRKKMEPKLCPKHHYLRHYPELIAKFGPLTKVWTMRFESKHSYFKRALRYSKNYINVTKSLSLKHEHFQSLLRLGADIRPEIDMKGVSNFRKSAHNDRIQAAIEKVHLPNNIQECIEVTVKGIVYQKEDYLAIQQKGYQYGIEIGKISIVLTDEETVFMVFEVLETQFIPHLRVYRIGSFVRYECLSLDDLPSTEKLHSYNVGTYECVKPNYGFVERPL